MKEYIVGLGICFVIIVLGGRWVYFQYKYQQYLIKEIKDLEKDINTDEI